VSTTATLIDLLRVAAAQFGERPAVSCRVGLRTRVWTFAELWGVSNAVAAHLRRDRELAPGTAVVVWAPNSPQLVAVYFGVMLGRLILVPIDPTATPAFVARVAAAVNAGLVITGSGPAPPTDVPVISIDEVPNSAGVPFPEAPTADEVAEVVFTSGTTGTPKGVVLTHRNIVANVNSALRLVPPRPLRMVSILPLSHMLEQTVGLYAPLVLGSSIHYPSSRRAPVLIKAMRHHRVTAMVLVPQALDLMFHGIEREVARRGRQRQWDLAQAMAGRLPMPLRRLLFRSVHRRLGGCLDFVICGGAPLPPESAVAWERLGIRIVEGYGATECSPIVTANTYWDRVPGSVGRPVPGVAVRISSDGEVLARGANVTRGYWKDAAATAQAIDTDGWYHTGDLGRFDEGGRVALTGRLSDRIVLPNGLNVYPEDVERELLSEPAVRDCVVLLAVSDASANAGLHAVIIPEGDHTADSADVVDAVRRAGTRLAAHQHVAGFTIWPELDFPRTSLLKVKRHEVAAAVAAGVGSRRGIPVAVHSPDDAGLGRIAAILATVTEADPATVTRDSDLAFDVGLDSLGRVELAALLETELGVVPADGDLADLSTVGELCDVIAAESPAEVAPPLPAWPRRRIGRVLRAALQRLVIFPIHRLVARPFEVVGRAHLDGVDGPVLIVANHSSHIDTPSILRALPGRIRRTATVAAAADYFYRSAWISVPITAALGTFPFSREGAVRTSLEQCGELVDDGWSVLVYPEGTRSTTGAMAPFRTGIGLLATELQVPVIPVGITGAHGVWPKGSRRPRRGPVTVRFGTPIVVLPADDRDELVSRLETAVAALIEPA
jgi:long-chain acyl-CoA synthetase